MPKRTQKTWKTHKAKFKNCTECPLCDVRINIVLAKGKIPADVVFIGEAPGASENVIGKPFVGPAGKLFHRIVDSVVDQYDDFSGLRFAFTNLIACIPKNTKGGPKVHTPPKESIQKCYPRLEEFVELCKPSALVAVGKVAEKHVSTLFIEHEAISVTHPAAILREDRAMQDLSIQRVQVQLADLFHSIVSPN